MDEIDREDIPDLVDGVPVEDPDDPDTDAPDTDDPDTDDPDDADTDDTTAADGDPVGERTYTFDLDDATRRRRPSGPPESVDPDPDADEEEEEPDPEPESVSTSLFRAPDEVASNVDVDVTDEIRLHARYQAIHEAREDVAETLRDLSSHRIQALDALPSKMPREERQAEARRMVAVHLKDSVSAYLTEIEPMLSRLDGAEWYYREIPLGRITFDELQVEADRPAPGLNRGPGVSVDEHRTPDPVAINGLQEYLEAPNVFTRSLTHEQGRAGVLPGTEELTETQVVAMPPDISRAAFRAANGFCADVGLGLQVSDANEDAGFNLQ